MTTLRTRARAALAVVVATALTATMVAPVPSAAAEPPGFDWAALVPTDASVQAVTDGLPDDETEAVERLVDIVWGADSLAAVSATGEIMRRAGLPLVSADGPVMALPDGNVITNAPIIVEFLPTLTDAARNGTIYQPSQVAELLQAFGFAAELPTDREIVGLLSQWGKAHDDIPEVRAAGAAARAIARIRGELLIPITVPTPDLAQRLADDPSSIPNNVMRWLAADGAVRGIDPITAVLLLTHTGGELAPGAEVVPAGSGLRSTESGAFLPRVGGVNCEGISSDEASRADQESEGAAKEYAKSQTRDAAESAAQRYGGEAAKKWASAAGEAYDKLTDAISVVLLLLGAKLELKPDKERTHFRHKKGERAHDVTVTATASFSSALAKRHLACWALIGIDVPPDGKLKGYRVNWRLSSAPEVFQAFSESRDKFRKGDTTGEGGVSKVSIYPRTELKPPGDGEELPEPTIYAKVEAGLDKDDFPWKFSDLMSMAAAGGIAGAGLSALYNLLMSLMKRGALPTKILSIPVKYHGQLPFVMQGKMHAKAAFSTIDIDLRADLYSCTGPLGPWQGTVGAGGNVAITHTGSAPQISGSGQGDFPMRFQLAVGGQPQRFHVADGTGLQVDLDADAVGDVLNPAAQRDTYDWMKGRSVVVGTGTWTLDGKEIAKALGATRYMTWGAGSDRFDVVGKYSDARCGGSNYWEGSQSDKTEQG